VADIKTQRGAECNRQPPPEARPARPAAEAWRVTALRFEYSGSSPKNSILAKIGGEYEDVAKVLGASVQAVRQARLNEESKGFRAPPKNWKAEIIRLAESRVLYYRRLTEKLKTTE
jgi:hypothetical protein